MARAQHEPHSGGSLCLGTSGETGQPQAIVLTFPLPREKSKNTQACLDAAPRGYGPDGPTPKLEEDASQTCRCRTATRSCPAPSSSHLEVHALLYTCSARNTIICDTRASQSFHGHRGRLLALSVERNGQCVSPEQPQKAAQRSHSPRQERRGSPGNTVLRGR